MSYIITTLYTVFLGMLMKNLLQVQMDGGTRVISVFPLVTSGNAMRAIPLLLLFFVDWFCFILAFPPGTPFEMSPRDTILLICTILSLALLGAGVTMSLEESRRFCLPIGLYHVGTALAEAAWICAAVVAKSSPIDGKKMTSILILVVIYVVLRLLFAFMYFLMAVNHIIVARIALQVPAIGALLVKPTFLIIASQTLGIELRSN